MAGATGSPETDVIAESATWYSQRSGLRYHFVAAAEVVDRKSGKQVTSQTANLSHSGCHVRTDTPFGAGTIVKVTARAGDKTFQSEGKVIYSISGEGMGIRFDNIDSAQEMVLNKWLMQASGAGQERRLRESREAAASGKRKILFVLGALILAAGVVWVFAWLDLLPKAMLDLLRWPGLR